MRRISTPLLLIGLSSLLMAADKPGFPFSLYRSYDEKIPVSVSPADTAGTTVSTTEDWVIGPPEARKPEHISLSYTVGDTGIVEGGGIKLSLGHLLPTEQGIYTPFSLTVTSAYFFGIDLLKDIKIHCSDPTVKLKVTQPRPAAYFKQVLRYVRYKRSEGAHVRDSLLRQIDNEFAVRIEVTKGPLKPGTKIEVTMGARKGLPAPKSEASWQIITRVDGDGDGIYGLVKDAPDFDAYSLDTQKVVLLGPTSMHAGDSSHLSLHTADGYFLPNLSRFQKAVITLKPQAGLEFPLSFQMDGTPGSWDGSLTELPIKATAEGLYRIVGEAVVDGKTFSILSNPIEVVPADQPLVYFGDLHLHSILSYDADRPPQYVYWRQQYEERHDFAALTDHDMIGAVPFAKRDGISGRTPDEWAYIKKLGNSFNQPGRFVTLLGYEWTSYYFGHRNIIFSPEETDPPLFHHNQTTTHEPYDEELPGELAGHLHDHHYIAIPHSTAWPTRSVQYHWGPGDAREDRYGHPEEWSEQRELELYSTHGTSEYYNNEYAVDQGHPEAPTKSGLIRSLLNYNIKQAPEDSGNFAQDALAHGWQFGFIGSSDDHYLSHIDQAYKLGIAAVFAPSLSREGIWQGLWDHHSYAATGVRILMHFFADGQPMGSTVKPAGEAIHFTGLVAGTGMLQTLELARYDGTAWTVAWSASPKGELDFKLDYSDPNPRPGSLYYLRARQEDGNRAWSSPIWIAKE